MSEERPTCPKCNHEEPIKSGHACGRQRWKCKGCGFEYTRLTPKGKPAAMKAHAVALYTSGLSYRRIGFLLGVSGNAVSKWVDAYADRELPAKPLVETVNVVEMDEQWHFLGKKATNSGCAR